MREFCPRADLLGRVHLFGEIIILSKSKEDYTRNILGFGGNCVKKMFAFGLKKGFQKYLVGDPYHIELKAINILSYDDKKFVVLETRKEEFFLMKMKEGFVWITPLI